MASRNSRYGKFFPTNHRVQVGIPRLDGTVFPEWGTVISLYDDLVTLRLSREQLPENAILAMGGELELRVEWEGAFYACQALIVEDYNNSTLPMRLLGEMSIKDLREYYRMDVFL